MINFPKILYTLVTYAVTVISSNTKLKQLKATIYIQNEINDILFINLILSKVKINYSFGKNKRSNFLEVKPTKTEAAANKGNSRVVYRITKDIAGDTKKLATTTENKSGRLLTRKEEINNRWKKYLHEILNFSLPADPADPSNGQPLFQLDMSIEPIGLHEVKTVLRKLKSGKAASIEDIHPGLLKYGAGVLAEPLHKVLIQIWDTEDFSIDWKKGDDV